MYTEDEITLREQVNKLAVIISAAVLYSDNPVMTPADAVAHGVVLLEEAQKQMGIK